MRFLTVAAALLTLLSSHALAYEATNAPQHAPSDVYPPNDNDLTSFGGAFPRSVLNKLNERPSVQDAGAICDGTADAGPTINALLARGVKQIGIPKGAVCRTSVTIAIPGASTLEGTGFAAGNPASGSTILCDAGVSPCVQVGNRTQPFGASLRRMIVKRAGGQPPADKIGVLIDGDYNPVVSDVMSFNHGQGFVLRIAGPHGLGGQFTRVFTGAISDAHVVFDGWTEARFSQSRLGMNGGGDYLANTYVRFQGGISGSAAGPNTITFQNTQLNQGNKAVHHAVEFVNLAAPVPRIDAVEFNFDNVHVEGVDQAAIYSDASWNVLSRSHVTGSTFNLPKAKFFALNSGTTFDDFALIGNHIYTSDLSVAPTRQINNFRIIGNKIAGTTSIAAGAGGGATAVIDGNTFVGNLSLSGIWGQLNAFGNLWTAGALVNNATGNFAIGDAQNGLIASGSAPIKTTVLYGVTDANGNIALPHGVVSAVQRVVSVSAFVRDPSGAAILIPATAGAGGFHLVVDGTNVNIKLTSAYATRKVRVKLEYQTLVDPNW